MLYSFPFVTILAYAAISFAQEPPTMPHAPPYTCTTSTTTYCQPGLGVSPSDQRQFHHQHHPNTTHDPKLTQGRPGKTGATGRRGEKGDKGEPCQCDVADEEQVTELRQKMERLQEQNRKLLQKIEELSPFYPTNCSEYRTHHNNTNQNDVVELYPMKSIRDMTPVMINCTFLEEMQQSNDWIVIQRRQDGLTDFYRDWKSYREGFGDLKSEFWLGLLYIHWLTTAKEYKLRIDMTGYDGAKTYAEYSTFRIASEESNYRLSVSGHTGTAGDRLTYHDGSMFTTVDRDNDVLGKNCARVYHGAWWYKHCHYSNLNGEYSGTKSSKSAQNVWKSYTVQFDEMKIRLVA